MDVISDCMVVLNPTRYDCELKGRIDLGRGLMDVRIYSASGDLKNI